MRTLNQAGTIEDVLTHLDRLLSVLRSLPDPRWVRRFERVRSWLVAGAEPRPSFDEDMSGFGTLLESTPLLYEPLSRYLAAFHIYSRQIRKSPG